MKRCLQTSPCFNLLLSEGYPCRTYSKGTPTYPTYLDQTQNYQPSKTAPRSHQIPVVVTLTYLSTQLV